ncbi:MAG: DoxX family protein [Myxococcales bacterium]
MKPRRSPDDESPGTSNAARGQDPNRRVFTALIGWEMVAGSLWDVLQITWVRVQLTHLGYPLYLGYVAGPWKLAGAAAILVPRFPRLKEWVKEWAYAGSFFNYTTVPSRLICLPGTVRPHG